MIDVWLNQYNRIRAHYGLASLPPVPKTIFDFAKIIAAD